MRIWVVRRASETLKRVEWSSAEHILYPSAICNLLFEGFEDVMAREPTVRKKIKRSGDPQAREREHAFPLETELEVGWLGNVLHLDVALDFGCSFAHCFLFRPCTLCSLYLYHTYSKLRGRPDFGT